MEIEQNFISKNVEENILNKCLINDKKIFQYKELRLPTPQEKNMRFRFIIDQSYQEKTDLLKVKVEQLDKFNN